MKVTLVYSNEDDSRKVLIFVSLVLISSLGFFIRLGHLSHFSPLIFDDSYVYVLSAETLAKSGRSHIPLGFSELQVGYPIGYPLLIAITFLLFGFNQQLPIILSTVLGTLSILLMYLIAEKLFDWKVGLLASLFLALDPIQITLSEIVGSDIPAQFFLLSGFLLLIIQIKENKTLYSILSGLFFGYSVLIRQPNIIVFIPILTLILSKKYNHVTKRKIVYTLFVASLVFLPFYINMLTQTKTLFFNKKFFVDLQPEPDPTFKSFDMRYAFFGFRPKPKCDINIYCYWDYWHELILGLHPYILRTLACLMIPRIPNRDILPPNFIPFNVTPFLGFLALLGFAVSWKRKKLLFSHMFFLLWSFVFVGFYIFFYFFVIRYYLPIFPFIYLFAAFFCNYITTSKNFSLLKIFLIHFFPILFVLYSFPKHSNFMKILLLALSLSFVFLLRSKSVRKDAFDKYIPLVTFAVILSYFVFLLYISNYLRGLELVNPPIEKPIDEGVFFGNIPFNYVAVTGRPIVHYYYTHKVSIPLHKFSPKEIKSHYPQGITILFDPYTTYYYGEYQKMIDALVYNLNETDSKKYPVYVTIDRQEIKPLKQIQNNSIFYQYAYNISYLRREKTRCELV